MYIVRKAFRNHGSMITPGSIVEPGDIKWFKTRLRDRKIIEVSESELGTYEEYFLQKFGVSINNLLVASSDAQVNSDSEAGDNADTIADAPATTAKSIEMEPVKPIIKPTEKIVVKAVN